MATASINVRMIAQGSSERQISICVDAADCAKALRAAHAALALSNTQISIVVLGATGAVGPCTHTPLSPSLYVYTPSMYIRARSVGRMHSDTSLYIYVCM